MPERLTQAAAVALAGLLVAGCGDDGERPTTQLTATPLTATPASPSPTPTPSASPTASPTPIERPPTDADRARFVTEHRPEGATDIRHVAVDVDADLVDELVFAMLLDGRVHVEIAWWQGDHFEVEATADGVAATRINSIAARDVNGDGRTEIVVQHASDDRAGLDLWAVDDRDLDEVDGRGGCADGNSFGDLGARLADVDGNDVLEIAGTCDGLLGLLGPSDVTWFWDGDVYVAADPEPDPDGDGDEDDD